MKVEEAIEIANQFVRKKFGYDLPFLNAKIAPMDSSKFCIVYETIWKGSSWDGPTVVLVDLESRVAEFFESL